MLEVDALLDRTPPPDQSSPLLFLLFPFLVDWPESGLGGKEKERREKASISGKREEKRELKEGGLTVQRTPVSTEKKYQPRKK